MRPLFPVQCRWPDTAYGTIPYGLVDRYSVESLWTCELVLGGRSELNTGKMNGQQNKGNRLINDLIGPYCQNNVQEMPSGQWLPVRQHSFLPFIVPAMFRPGMLLFKELVIPVDEEIS